MKIKLRKNLTQFEILKLSNKVFFLCLILIIVYSTQLTLFLPLNRLHTASYKNENDEIINLEGKKALEILKKMRRKHKGKLSTEKFKKSFFKYKDVLKNNWMEEWSVWYTEYNDIDKIFLQAFSKPGQINHFIKDNLKLKDLEYIYSDRIFALEESMNLNENKIHSSHMIRKQAEIIKTPFYYDGFYLGWNRVISGGKIYKYFFIILILCSSFVFYEEIIFSSSIEFSLATKNGRKVHSIAKIKALIIITTIIFIFSIGLYTMLTFYVFGTDGGKNQMQILSFYSLFNGTLAQATILRFAILYFAGIFFSILTFFISLYIKNMLATIVLSGACFYIGTVIPKGSIFERLIFLFPSSAISFSQLFYRPIVYNFFGKPILLCYMYIPASIAMSIILSVLIVRKFEKMEY